MRNTIFVSVPNSEKFLPVVLSALDKALEIIELKEQKKVHFLHSAEELVRNAMRYAYLEGEIGMIDVELTYKPHGIMLDVHDMGIPIDEKRIFSIQGGGLERIRKKVEKLEFINKGQEGKSFRIFQSFNNVKTLQEKSGAAYSDLADNSPASLKPLSIKIRDFQSGDEEAIAQLIYNNYTYSYYKDLFYFPQKIKKLNENKEIFSIVAEDLDSGVIGHFAFVKLPHANTAEIGVAVVDPRFKGQGIMNAMLEYLLKKAKALHFNAIFGEAIMLHPYSQKANLAHGFTESALLLGIVPNTISLRDKNALHTDKRTAVLVGYKIFKTRKEPLLYMPKRYEDLIRQIYMQNSMQPQKATQKSKAERNILSYEVSPYTNTGVLIVDEVAEKFKKGIRYHLGNLFKKHLDMIFADINLIRCTDIDAVVKFLRKEGFVFGGVLFYRHGDDDYLRMQLVNSDNVETRNIVCHSEFCHRLLHVVNEELREN